METYSSRKSTNKFQRSLSPSGKFCSSSISTNPTHILTRPTSPTRVTVSPSSSSFRLTPIASNSKTCNISQGFLSKADMCSSYRNRKTVSCKNYSLNNNEVRKNRSCACSPTTHPGSYRCSLHKGNSVNEQKSLSSSYKSSHQLNMRRSAMTNSLVRIGTVEGELVKRALASLIRPSSHSLRRRFDFRPRKSRLSVMSKAEEN